MPTSDVTAERDWWDALADDDVAANMCHVGTRASLNELVPLLGPLGGTVLDLGCGIGRLAIPLAADYQRIDVVGVDIAPSLIARARAADVPNARFVVGDGRTLPDTVGALGAAYSMCVFQHLTSEQCASYVAQVGALLGRRKRFVFQVVMGDAPDGFLSHQCASPDEPRGWVNDAGLFVHKFAGSALCDEWAWCVAVKP